LYELRRQYPTIDGFGLLNDELAQTWLTFIKVSIQSYRDHDEAVLPATFYLLIAKNML